MPMTILTTKLFIPPRPQNIVPRKYLIEQLNIGLARKLALVSAPAGFGKTTLISEWIAQLTAENGAAIWLSLDNSDNNLARFLTYFVECIKRIEGISPDFGKDALGALQTPGQISIEP